MRWGVQLVCNYCEEDFEATRSDAKFCSGKCRQAFNRRKARRAKAEKGITEGWGIKAVKGLGYLREQVHIVYPYLLDIYIEHGGPAAEAATLALYDAVAHVIHQFEGRLATKQREIDRLKLEEEKVQQVREIVGSRRWE